MKFTYLLVAVMQQSKQMKPKTSGQVKALETSLPERRQAASDRFSFDLTVKACVHPGEEIIYMVSVS